jgi:hypothetical protein
VQRGIGVSEQYRRFDFEEAACIEKISDRLQKGGALMEEVIWGVWATARIG